MHIIKLRLNYAAQGWSPMMLIMGLEEIPRSLRTGRDAEPTCMCKNLEGREGALLGEAVASCRWEGRAGKSCSGSL